MATRSALLGAFGILFLPSIEATEVVAGKAVSLSVTADGSKPFTYQWQKNNNDIAAANAETYRIASIEASDAGSYTAIVSNSAGSATSDPVNLTVQTASTGSSTPATPPSTITINSASQIATAGHDVSFTATGATAGGQWQVSSDGGSTWSNLPGDGTYHNVTSTTLEITDVTSLLSNNRYRYLSAGSASNSAVLTVAPVFFPFPVGIAVDGAGNLYVSDTAADTIQKISQSGAVTLTAGSAGHIGTMDGMGPNARFNDPTGIASAADGTLEVADSANATIRQISATGLVSTLAGSTTIRGHADGNGTAATFSSPLGLAVDANGTLYLADAQNNLIRKISPAGTVSTLAGASTAGSADGTGTVARFNYPSGIATDSSGAVYVADSINNTVRKISSAGTVSTLAGLAGVSGFQDGTGGGALFNHPGGLATDGSGNLYVADTGNSTIRKITPAGSVSTLAGLPGIAGLMDGSGSAAWFNQPQGLATDTAGNLYVADTGNAAIRKVSSAGAVTTLSLSDGSSSADSNAPLPATPTTPSTPSSGTGADSGSSSSSGGGGGGGAVNGWFVGALAFVYWLRRVVRKP